MKYFSKALLVLFLALSGNSSVIADCTAAMITALKTNYSSYTGQTNVEFVRYIVCANSSSSGGLSFGGVSFSGEDVRSECSDKTSNFFSQNQSALAMSFLPEHVNIAELCGSNDGLSLTAISNSSQITIEARWADVTGKLNSLTIESVVVLGPVDCNFSSFSKGHIITAGRRYLVCDRLDEGNATFLLTTKENISKVVQVKQEIQKREYFFLQNVKTGKCLDAYGRPAFNVGVELITYDCEMTFIDDKHGNVTDQLWKFSPNGQIINKLNKACIGTKSSATKNSANLVLAACDNLVGENASAVTRWSVDHNGFIVNQLSGRCIDIKGYGRESYRNNRKIQIFDCERGKADTDQQWRLVYVDV